jgi:hypothetical protein
MVVESVSSADGYGRGKAGAQSGSKLSVVDENLDRYSLDDFGVVAGRVVGRKQRKL